MIRFVVVLLVTLLALSGMTPSRVAAQDALSVLDDLETRLSWASYRLAEERWEYLTTGVSDSLPFFEHLTAVILSDHNASESLKTASIDRDDNINRRRLDYLRGRMLITQLEMSPDIRTIRDTLMDAFMGYRYMFEGQPRTSSDLYNILSTSGNRSAREAAFRALASVGEITADPLGRLLRIRNQQAGRQGYNSYTGLLFTERELSLEDYEKLLEQIEVVTREPYQAAVGRLKQAIGVDQLEMWDMRYVPARIRNLVNNALTPDSIETLAFATFADLGFDLSDMPIYFYFSDSSEVEPGVQFISVRPPFDQRVGGRLNQGYNSMRQLFAALGMSVYSANVRQDVVLFDTPAEGPMSAGVQNFFEDMVGTPEWLNRYMGLSGNRADEFVQFHADQRLVEVRFWLVDQLFELQCYKNPLQDMSRLYWEYLERYLNVSRQDDIPVWAATPHHAMSPLRGMTELLGLVIASQNRAYLEKINSTIVANRDTRSFLNQNYFRFGRRYEWPEMLQRGTGEDINPSYLVR